MIPVFVCQKDPCHLLRFADSWIYLCVTGRTGNQSQQGLPLK